jgi:cytochrome c-type biogenesis protein CcmH/NrfF
MALARRTLLARRLALAGMTVAGLVCLFAAPVSAQEGTPAPVAKVTEAEADRMAARISDELASPYCPGKTLKHCTSGQAFTLRQEIKEMFLAGKTAQEIGDLLTVRYGEDLRTPEQPWYASALPFLALGAGILLLIVVFWRHRAAARARPAPATPTAAPADDDRLAKLRARVAHDVDD